ncbi:hypothetical protein GYRE_00374 [Yokenella regensburgei ATCC 49455]|nr:hypothetical protein HMPREF0880_00356 [Yokenella regensburgei ATCC 43003]KFD25322.1 hypothetical protein GYRE_00374 [Yokenella regensburgei ATCC 49455]
MHNRFSSLPPASLNLLIAGVLFKNLTRPHSLFILIYFIFMQ